MKKVLSRYKPAAVGILRVTDKILFKFSLALSRAAVILFQLSVALAKDAWKLLKRLGHRLWAKILAWPPAERFYLRTKHHHNRTIGRAHNHLLERWRWYSRWHSWQWHPHVHYSTVAAFILAMIFWFGSFMHALASDLSNLWNFGTPADYQTSSGAEVSGSTGHLRVNEYTNDANTTALYHLNESSGTSVADSSSNSNTGTATSPTWGSAGKLNYSLSLNGTTTTVSAPDSASLSLTGANTIEAWTKFGSSFSSSSSSRQPVISKGAYQLYYDSQTGKITYELANSSNSWTQVGGMDASGQSFIGGTFNNSWDVNSQNTVEAMIKVGSYIYTGTGQGSSDALVWRWDGTSWLQIGGRGLNNSWSATAVYQTVYSLATDGTNLYAGLGSGTGNAEVWLYNGSSWTKVGGDGLNGSWNTNYESVHSLAVSGTTVYAGLGDSAGDAEVWQCTNCTTSPAWTQVGGDGVNSSWTSGSNKEMVASLRIVGTKLLAGLGISATDGELWSTDTGTISWTKLGGSGTGSAGQSWDTTHERVAAITNVGNVIYVGLGDSTGDAEVWSCDISATCTNTAGWTQVGGDGVNTSWNTNYERVFSLTVDGSNNIYAGLGLDSGDAEVWKYNGTSWTQIGGDSLNSSWTATTMTDVRALLVDGSTLYSGVSNTSATTYPAEVWTTNLTTISWTRIGGDGINKSWPPANFTMIDSMTTYKGKLIAGLPGSTFSDSQVWEYDGNTWDVIGGQGVNSSWTPNTYADVWSLISDGTNLYAGLGTGTGKGEVWQYNGTSWSKIGGGGVNSSWNGNYDRILAMAVYGGAVYAGTGQASTSGTAELWKYSGGSWTKVGGDGLNGSWVDLKYEFVESMTTWQNKLYVGLGANTGDNALWQYDGTNWAQIGGDCTGACTPNSGSAPPSGSWSNTTGWGSELDSLASYNGKLYAGMGIGTGNAVIWQCDPGCTQSSGWTKIGGDGLNGSWAASTYEKVYAMVVYNGSLYAGLGDSAGDGEVWQYDGSTWTLVATSGNPLTWGTSIECACSLNVYKGKLYAGKGRSASNDAQVWSYGDNLYLQSAATSQDTNWHHIAATYDGTTAKIYIDGVVNATTTKSLAMPDTSGPLYIGSSYGSQGDGRGEVYFNGQIDEVRISNVARTSFNTTTYSTASQTIQPGAAVFTSGVASFDSFADTETLNGGTINFRVSSDGGSSWQYWSGSSWSTSSSLSEANPASTINAHISTFPVTGGGIKWQAILTGSGEQLVTLNSVTINATSDTTAPDNPASVTAKDSPSGSTTLTSGNWYNYTGPYFSWSAPSDPPSPSGGTSGVAGYYVYFGTDNTADPLTAGTFQAAANYTAGSLTSGNTYYLRIKTKDAAGNVNSTTAALFTYKFDSIAPDAVAYVNVSPAGCSTASSFTFSWPASSDASSGIAGYQYRLGSTGVVQDLSNVLTVDAPPYQVGDNVFYVRAKDAAGNTSAWQTGVYCSTETATVVDGPTVVAGASSITVSWTSSKATTSFVKVQDGNTYISEQGQSSFSISHTVKVVGLEPEKSYQYQLTWTDSSGNPGQTPFFTTSTSTAPAVKNLTSQILGPSSTLLSWQTTELSSASIEYGIGNFNSTKDLSGTATSFTQQLTGLVPGSNYQVRIAARTQDGYPYFSVITFQTPPLPKISDVRFDYLPTAQASVRVSWQTNVPSTSLVRFTPQGGVTQIASSAELATDHAITLDELLDNTNYQIVAVSTDQYGNSGTSDPQNYATPFDTRPPKINNLNIEIKSSGVGTAQKAQIVVSWETDEPATSQVEYGPGISSDSYSSRTQEDRILSTTHVVIVSNLDPAKLYHLRAVSKDRSSNTGTSIDTTAITGRIQNSVIDLIINALQRSLNFLTKLPLLGR